MKIKAKSFLALCLLCFTLLAAATSCSPAVKLTMDDKTGNLCDNKNNIVYKYAPTCYEPITVGEEYAVWKQFDMTFYSIEGVDATKFLTTGESDKTLIYSSDITLPGLSEMNVNKIMVCLEQKQTVALSEITETEMINFVVTLFTGGIEKEYSSKAAQSAYKIKFSSDSLPGIYYTLDYFVYSDGTGRLYERNSGRCVAADGLFDAYVD